MKCSYIVKWVEGRYKKNPVICRRAATVRMAVPMEDFKQKFMVPLCDIHLKKLVEDLCRG